MSENNTAPHKRVNKGKETPPETLVKNTLELIENGCKTNDQIFIIRNIIALMSNGLEFNIRNIIRVLQDHGEDTRVIIKDDKTNFEYQKDFGIPATNIGYLFGPISKGIWKNNISLDQIMSFQTKSSSLIKELKEMEQLGIDIVVENNIGTRDIPSGLLRKKIDSSKMLFNQKKEKQRKSDNKVLEDEESKVKLEEQKLAKKKEKNKKLKEKQKVKRELRKKNLITFIETNPEAINKTQEEWSIFAKENGIKINDTYESQDAIFQDILSSTTKIIGNVPKEDISIKTQEASVESVEIIDTKELLSKDSKKVSEWIEYADDKKIDLAGATLKDDIYDLIKLDHENKEVK